MGTPRGFYPRPRALAHARRKGEGKARCDAPKAKSQTPSLPCENIKGFNSHSDPAGTRGAGQDRRPRGAAAPRLAPARVAHRPAPGGHGQRAASCRRPPRREGPTRTPREPSLFLATGSPPAQTPTESLSAAAAGRGGAHPGGVAGRGGGGRSAHASAAPPTLALPRPRSDAWGRADSISSGPGRQGWRRRLLLLLLLPVSARQVGVLQVGTGGRRRAGSEGRRDGAARLGRPGGASRPSGAACLRRPLPGPGGAGRLSVTALCLLPAGASAPPFRRSRGPGGARSCAGRPAPPPPPQVRAGRRGALRSAAAGRGRGGARGRPLRGGRRNGCADRRGGGREGGRECRGGGGGRRPGSEGLSCGSAGGPGRAGGLRGLPPPSWSLPWPLPTRSLRRFWAAQRC